GDDEIVRDVEQVDPAIAAGELQDGAARLELSGDAGGHAGPEARIRRRVVETAHQVGKAVADAAGRRHRSPLRRGKREATPQYTTEDGHGTVLRPGCAGRRAGAKLRREEGHGPAS